MGVGATASSDRREHRSELGAVGNVLARARAAGLSSLADIESLDDEALEAQALRPEARRSAIAPEPDCAWIHRERARPGVTLELLHHEYLEVHANGYAYTAFCTTATALWLRRRGVS